MQAIVKSYLPSFLVKRFRKTKPKPPAFRQRKHLRRRPGLLSRAWTFCRERIRPKAILITTAVLAALLIVLGTIGYHISFLEPVEITHFGAKPNWTGPYKIDNALQHAASVPYFSNLWPTAMEMDSMGDVFVSAADGTIVKIQKSKNNELLRGHVSILAQGPVLNATLPHQKDALPNAHAVGMRYAEGTNLLFILDAYYGLCAMEVNQKKRNVLLPLSGNESGIIAPTDMTIAKFTPEIFITDFSTKWSGYYRAHQILEGSCTGRVFKYDFGTETLSLLLSGLCAPVGIEIVAEDHFLLVTEAGRPRIRVVQLNTTSTIKYVPLPGIPGKPRINVRGGCWVPMRVINDNFFNFANGKPWLRKAITGILPEKYLRRLMNKRHTIVAEMSPDGNIVGSLHDTDERSLNAVDEVHEASSYRLLFSSESNEHLAMIVGKLEEQGRAETGEEEEESDDEGEVIEEELKKAKEKSDETEAKTEL